MKCKIAFTPQGNDSFFFFLVAHGRFCETWKFFVQIFVCIWNAFCKSQFYAYLFQRPSRSSNSMFFKCNITAEKERPLSVHLRPLENCQKFGYIPGQICTSNYTVTCIFLCLDLGGFRANSFSHITSQLLVTYIMFGRLTVEEFFLLH